MRSLLQLARQIRRIYVLFQIVLLYVILSTQINNK